ncbi:MAG: FCD domain-containing protein, partial [Pseudomonadota bacterium]
PQPGTFEVEPTSGFALESRFALVASQWTASAYHVRRYVVWGDLETNTEGPESEYHSFAEHERIVNAIERRNGALAVEAMLDHLKATNSQLSDNRTL